jgi:MoxR-like ATPase
MTLRDKMLAVIADTNDSVAEREELVEMIAIALLTRKNLFVLGEPGQAKSYAINLFRRHITGARQFERLLSKQSDEEQLFGRVDLASLLPGSVPPTVLEQDATYQNQRFNLRVLGHRLHEGRARNMGKAQERHRKAGALSCSALGASQKRAHGADSRQNSRGRYRIAG